MRFRIFLEEVNSLEECQFHEMTIGTMNGTKFYETERALAEMNSIGSNWPKNTMVLTFHGLLSYIKTFYDIQNFTTYFYVQTQMKAKQIY